MRYFTCLYNRHTQKPSSLQPPRFGSLFLLSFLVLSAPLLDQQVYSGSLGEKCEYENESTWTWIDKVGNRRSLADFQEIVSEHTKWIHTSYREGKQSNLSATKLKSAIVSNVDFNKGNFTGSDLSYADFRSANLGESEFRGATLYCARLDGASFNGVDFTGMDFSSATLSGARFDSATLVRAKMKGRDLLGASFNRARLSEADLTDANLAFAEFAEADLRGANLKGARLIDTRLSGAQLHGADLSGAIYEASTTQSPNSIAFAKNIEYLTHTGNSASLAALRSMFKETGFRDQERKITFALKSRQGELLWESCVVENRICFEYWINRILFDLTSQYGMNPGRVLILILIVFCVATALYWWMIHCQSDSGLSIVVPVDRDRSNQPLWLLANLSKTGDHRQEGGATTKVDYKIQPRNLEELRGKDFSRALICRETALLGVSFIFSLMSMFNIKFRDVDFGRWLRQLTTKEYDIKATGWGRTVSGVQALLSVYLVALLLVTYFGRPFE